MQSRMVISSENGCVSAPNIPPAPDTGPRAKEKSEVICSASVISCGVSLGRRSGAKAKPIHNLASTPDIDGVSYAFLHKCNDESSAADSVRVGSTREDVVYCSADGGRVVS